jgi:hypothetical protein
MKYGHAVSIRHNNSSKIEAFLVVVVVVVLVAISSSSSNDLILEDGCSKHRGSVTAVAAVQCTNFALVFSKYRGNKVDCNGKAS